MINFRTKFGRKAWKHIKNEYMVWLTTVGENGMPQPRPVWFVWDKGEILIFSQPGAYKVKHIARHKEVSLHFNSDPKGEQDVIVLLGTARIDESSPQAHLIPAYVIKYRKGIKSLNSTLEEFGKEYAAAIRITLANIRGW